MLALRWISPSPEATQQAARRLAAGIEAVGLVIGLVGPLGAGKTAFARGLAEGLGADSDAVSSPTFTIVQEYAGRVRMQHVDLYRLSPAEVDDLALEDLWEDSVLVVEWPDRWARRPTDAVIVEIEHAGGDERRIRISDHSH